MTFHIEGLDRLEKKIGKLQADRWKQEAVRLAADTITSEVSEYPPPSEANRPGANRRRWYQRGWGEKWRTGGRRTSEQLGQKWTTKVKGLMVEIGNVASYAIYVQGKRQAKFHKMRGWKRLDKTADRLLPQIAKQLQRKVHQILGG